jgi:hypothetical protein
MFPRVFHNGKRVFKSAGATFANGPRMMRLLLILILLAASPLNAQSGVRPPRGWSLGVFGGGAAFTDFQRSTVQAATLSQSGQAMAREFPRSVGAETSGALAGTLAYWPGNNWGFRLRGAYMPTRFETIIPQSEAVFLNQPRSSADGEAYRAMNITAYESQVLFRMPTIRHRIMPYGIVGGGVVRYSLRNGTEPVPDEAQSDFDGATPTRPAVTIGLGAMLGLQRPGWGLHFELVDQIARTPVRGDNDDSINMTSSLTFMVGASWTSGN